MFRSSTPLIVGFVLAAVSSSAFAAEPTPADARSAVADAYEAARREVAVERAPRRLVAEAVLAGERTSGDAAREQAWAPIARAFENALAGDRENALEDLRAATLSPSVDVSAEATRILAVYSGAQPSLGGSQDPWFAYGLAYQLWVAHEPSRARARLNVLAKKAPGTPASEAAARAVARVNVNPPAEPVEGAVVTADAPAEPIAAPVVQAHQLMGEAPVEGAHWSLSSFQLLNGMALGIEGCVLAECSVGTGFLVAVGAAGLGLTASHVYGWARGGETYPGEAYAINAGTFWGAMNALFIYASANGDMNEGTAALPLMIGQVTGPVLGGLLWTRLRPSEDQVALANTFGIWGGVLAGFMHGYVNPDAEASAIFKTTMVAGNVGFVTGGFASRGLSITRKQTYVIDAGGIVGATLGVLSQSSSESDQSTSSDAPWIGGFVGTAVGVFVGTLFAHHVLTDADDDTVGATGASFRLVPHADGGLVGTWGGRF